jgi:hypothetical protein
MNMPAKGRPMTAEEIIDCRRRGWTIREILAEGANSEKEVYAALRSAGLCRDQRPEREYVVTVMVPEIVRVSAQSPAIAKRMIREEFNENIRIASVEEA